MPQTMTRPIPAKFAGVCRRTGARYPAGTLIIKGVSGWEIADDTIEDDEDEDDTTCPDGCPCHERTHRPSYARPTNRAEEDHSGRDAPDHGDRDAPPDYGDYNEDFYMLADHYDY